MSTQTLTLPTQRSEVDKRYVAQKFAMIGPPGIGKSEFWSFCNGLYIQTENGLNHLKVMKVPCRSWDDAKNIYSLLMQTYQKDGKLPYDTIIIDTIDKLVDLAQAEVVDRGRTKFSKISELINTVGDIPNGAGWAWCQELVENYLTQLEQLGCAIVYVGHLENKEIKEQTQSYHKQTISIGGKMGGMLVAWPDHLLNVSAKFQGNELKRSVKTVPAATLDAKSRGGMVKDGWQWPKNTEDAWKEFRAWFE